jgi:hypothetical protein
MVMLNGFVPVWLSESAACTVKDVVPAAATPGVPLIAPVLGFKFRPAGREPTTTLQVYGGVPPVAVTLLL